MTKNVYAARAEKLHTMFYPKSVAVMGANNVKGTVPGDIFYNLLKTGFQGVLYPVAPGEKQVASVKSYKYVINIEDELDLGIIVFPSSVTHMALEQCGQMGIKTVVIISAGFREVGGKGVALEQQILEIADKHDISFIGPNCLGIINTDPGVMLNASFAREMPQEGKIAFLSQSGALCTAVLDYAQAKHIGFSKFVSLGNKAALGEIELLYYLKDDPKTDVILLYLEDIKDGPALIEAAQTVIRETGKPILAIKSGRTEHGASAASSHTGSLAGSDDICDDAFRQAGIIRCDNIEEMFNKAIAFTYQPLPKDNRIAIVTNAGGPGVLTTDAAIKKGLRMANFSDETSRILKKKLPATANIKNPVDVIGDSRADRYEWAVSAVMEDPEVDGVFVILTPQSMTQIEEIATAVCEMSKKFDKPIYTSFMGEADVASGIGILQKNHIPHYILSESMTSAFEATSSFKKQLSEKQPEPVVYAETDRDKAHRILDKARSDGRTYLPEDESSEVLRAYGLPILESKVVQSAEEARTFAAETGCPVVMKVISDDIVHKTDVGGVVLDVATPDQAALEFDQMMKRIGDSVPDARIKGIMMRKMIPAGEEVILGLKHDRVFGPVVMFGLGGVFVELLKDVRFGVTPVDPATIEGMISGLKGSALFGSFRGRVARDMASVRECIGRLSQLAAECPQIEELDINPLIILEEGKGSFAADARIILKNNT